MAQTHFFSRCVLTEAAGLLMRREGKAFLPRAFHCGALGPLALTPGSIINAATAA